MPCWGIFIRYLKFNQLNKVFNPIIRKWNKQEPPKNAKLDPKTRSFLKKTPTKSKKTISSNLHHHPIPKPLLYPKNEQSKKTRIITRKNSSSKPRTPTRFQKRTLNTVIAFAHTAGPTKHPCGDVDHWGQGHCVINVVLNGDMGKYFLVHHHRYDKGKSFHKRKHYQPYKNNPFPHKSMLCLYPNYDM